MYFCTADSMTFSGYMRLLRLGLLNIRNGPVMYMRFCSPSAASVRTCASLKVESSRRLRDVISVHPLLRTLHELIAIDLQQADDRGALVDGDDQILILLGRVIACVVGERAVVVRCHFQNVDGIALDVSTSSAEAIFDSGKTNVERTHERFIRTQQICRETDGH